ncbi:acetoin utilization protein AcuC [Sediminibacillus halophilus]|uniref:Acetoin utilization protein AcuC n=1 Tax=Sediminibacillus halophilus TaxID=482461 RepID=A0A1G9Y6I9_9BACI|nr:acetoin utilization protein AcuC [Sediminibacillus halophilus]SDN04073.1 acetoin utilization protein AcuC [Sediminibacillus halophilus]
MKREPVFIYSTAYTDYHFNADHPFNQQRVVMTKELLEAEGRLFDHQIVTPRLAKEDELALVHDPRYIEAVKQAGNGQLQQEEAWQFGLGTEDTPMFSGMHEAASLLVGGTLTAIDSVLNNRAPQALNLGGGLHHGFKRKASGFCIYNDAAVAIKYIREHYGLRVLYVDTDAHHGDGVQSFFYHDPEVCTLSIHETGRYLFPGTGSTSERGVKNGYGYTFNLPVDAFTEDESFISLYESAFKEVAEYFQPDIIITQNGADAHCYDPLTHLCSTTKTFEVIPRLAKEIAEQYCGGKWIGLGGGGYDIWRVVPRVWGQLWSVMMTGDILTGPLPAEWKGKWERMSPVSLPDNWQDEAGIYKPIPRKQEITEKNRLTLNQCLQYCRNKQQYNNS